MQLEHILQAHGLIGRGGGKSKDNLPPPPITNFKAAVVGEIIKLTWSNPNDTDFIGLLILGKNGGYPTDINDGNMVLNKSIEDGGTIPTETIDNNVTLGVRRYYRAFPYDWDKNYQTDTGQQVSEIVKISQLAPPPPSLASRTSTSITLGAISDCEYRIGTGAWQDSTVFSGLSLATNYTLYARRKETSTHYASASSNGATFSTDKGTQSVPSAPTVSNLEHDRATVTGVAGTEVRLGTGTWFDSPHTFTSLTEETTYQAYARRKETSTHYASSVSPASEFTTPTAIDPNSWAGIQSIVRRGLTSEYFSIGDQLVSAYDGGEIIWEVIGIDVDIPTDPELTHSMTLQTKECLENRAFDDSNDNRYLDSPIRQYLNGGFLNKLDPELSAILGKVDKRVAKRDNLGGGQDSFSDKVFLLSRVEVDLGTEGTTTGESVYPFYDGKGNANRIKNLNDSPRWWWLRSPTVSHSYRVRTVGTGGSLNNNNANNSYGLSPACSIV